MSAHEKIGWLTCALFTAAWLLAAHTIIALLPGGANAEQGRVVLAHVTLWAAGVYLLLLLLRGVYIAGKSDGREAS
jgi:hypothetical protein